MHIRHQVTIVEGQFGWSSSVDSTVYRDTLNVDEDEHVYRSWTLSPSFETALGGLEALLRIAQNDVANYLANR